MAFKTPEKFRVYMEGMPAGDATNGFFVCKLRHGGLECLIKNWKT